MKKLILTAAALLAVVSVHGQGTVNFANVASGVVAPITDSFGRGVSNGLFRAQLYHGGGTSNNLAPEASLVPTLATGNAGSPNATPSMFQATAGRLVAMTVFTNPLLIPGGGGGTFQIRAWEAALGATWEEALLNAPLNPNRTLGKSKLFFNGTGDPNAVPPGLPSNLTGLGTSGGGFILTPVPEPSTMAFGLLGIGALLLLRRRK